MAWQSLTINLTDKNDAESFEDFLLELGALSITYSDAGDDPILEPDLNTTPLWQETFITALFEEQVDLFVIGAALVNEFGHEKFVINDAREIKDKPWEREWLKHFEPMKFGDSLWVCPSGMEIPAEEKKSTDVIITLDPGLAFGTGTHETTALCLEQLDSYDVSGLRVLDFGCGSGILAIAAHKLGASEVIGVDIDPQAITATLDNAERNNIDSNFYVYVTDEDDEEDVSWNKPESYDVIVANILSQPLINLAEKILGLLKPNGRLILSGIMQEQADPVRAAYTEALELEPTEVKGDWVAVMGSKKTSKDKRFFVPAEDIQTSQEKLSAQQDVAQEIHAIKHCPYCQHVQTFDLYDLEYADGKARCDNCAKIYNAFSAEDVAIESDTILLNDEESDNSDVPHLNIDDIRNFKPKLTRSATLQALTPLAEDSIEASIKNDLAQTLAVRPVKEVVDTVKNKTEPTLSDEELPPLLELDSIKNKQPKRRFNFVWAFLSLLGLTAISAQYIHYNRAELALHPKVGTKLTKVYAQIGLELEPNWQLSEYKSISNSVSLNPNDAKQLIVTSVVQNTANFAQPYPIVRLSLQNRWGEPIAFKDFRPKDYLEQPEQLLPAKQSHKIRVAVEDPGNEAMDYQSDICLEFGFVETTIQCQGGG